MYIERGMSAADAALLLASFTAAFMIANPLAGSISQNNDRRRLIALSASTSLFGILAIALLPQTMPCLFIPLIALGVGGSFTLGMVLPLDHARDANEANSWTAFVLGIGYFAGAFGPFLLGVARDSTGGFTVPVWMLVIAAVLMLSPAPLLHPGWGKPRDTFGREGQRTTVRRLRWAAPPAQWVKGRFRLVYDAIGR